MSSADVSVQPSRKRKAEADERVIKRRKMLDESISACIVTRSMIASNTRPRNDSDAAASPSTSRLRIAVLFDGAGLARLGLEQAGHECVGYELDPVAHYLSSFVGSGNCRLCDVRDLTIEELSTFDAIWASPPCQWRSSARTQGEPESKFADDLMSWCFDMLAKLPQDKIVWIENVSVQGKKGNEWGTLFNAAQFGEYILQNRNRVIGGRYPPPVGIREYAKVFAGACPCILASEYKGSACDTRRASRWYGRRLTLDECAYHQGFEIPDQWRTKMPGFEQTNSIWTQAIYRAIGNGVPVYMARAFGRAAVTPGPIE